MTNGRLVSYQVIVDKFYRDYSGLNFTLTDEQSLEWLGEFMSLSNSPMTLETKIGIIEVIDSRGKLPEDLHLIKQSSWSNSSLEDLECNKGTITAMRWATDNFHLRQHCGKEDYSCNSTITYQVNNNYIFTSRSKGHVVMSYKAIATDADGKPMIPADQQWVEGATKFLAGKVAAILWQRGDLTDGKFQYYERERDWYFAQAVNYSKMPSLDEMESFKNERLRTITDINAHKSFFKNSQSPEQRHWRKNFNGS